MSKLRVHSHLTHFVAAMDLADFIEDIYNTKINLFTDQGGVEAGADVVFNLVNPHPLTQYDNDIIRDFVDEGRNSTYVLMTLLRDMIHKNYMPRGFYLVQF